METAVAYIRVSSQRQVEEGSSLESQTKQVEQYALAHGFRLARLFREEGESAKTDQRPALQAMLAYCRESEHSVQVVIVPKIDRLARNVGDYTNLKLQLNRLGIRLESLGERIEDTPVGRFTETILASVAQFDNEIRAERSKGGMVEAVSQGRWVWKAPIGYRNVRHHGKGTIEPDPVLGPVVTEAFRLLAYGHADPPSVRAFLANAGVTCTESYFYRLLANEIYLGRIHAFGKVFEAVPPFLPLVDELTFYKAQAAVKAVNLPAHYQLESVDFPLRGTMRCEQGHYFTASWSRGKQGGRYPYYRCVRCQGRSFARTQINAHFRRELGAWRGREDAWERLKAKLLTYDVTVRTQEDELREAGLAQIAELKSLRDAVALKNASGVIPDDLAKAQIERLSDEIATVAASVPVIRSQPNIEELIAFAKRFFENLQDTWDELTLQKKKDLLRFMYPEGVLFLPEHGFRTPASSLSERVKRAISGVDLHLVAPELEISKELRKWLICLSDVAKDM